MIQSLEQIEYRGGLLEKGIKTDGLWVIIWRKAEIPADVRRAIGEEKLRILGGVYGEKPPGIPWNTICSS
jgi:hypothetical protein